MFEPGLGLVRNQVHKVKVRSNLHPTSFKLGRLPLSVRNQVSAELNRLLKEDVIEKIEASEWVSPSVAVRKPDGSIRLRVDLRGCSK